MYLISTETENITKTHLKNETTASEQGRRYILMEKKLITDILLCGNILYFIYSKPKVEFIKVPIPFPP